jgi:hypothetical protein
LGGLQNPEKAIEQRVEAGKKAVGGDGGQAPDA